MFIMFPEDQMKRLRNLKKKKGQLRWEEQAFKEYIQWLFMDFDFSDPEDREEDKCIHRKLDAEVNEERSFGENIGEVRQLIRQVKKWFQKRK